MIQNVRQLRDNIPKDECGRNENAERWRQCIKNKMTNEYVCRKLDVIPIEDKIREQ